MLWFKQQVMRTNRYAADSGAVLKSKVSDQIQSTSTFVAFLTKVEVVG